MIKGWLSKIVGGGAPEVPADVPAEWAERLAKAVAVLNELEHGDKRPNLANDVLRYVFQGEAVGVLHDLAKLYSPAQKLRLFGNYGLDKPFDSEIYAQIHQVPLPVILRWARVLTAAAKAQQPNFAIEALREHTWLEVLLAHAAGDSLNSYAAVRTPANYLTAELLERLCVEAGAAPHLLLTACFTITGDPRYFRNDRQKMVANLRDYSAYAEQHAEQLRPLLLPEGVPQRLHVLTMLAPLEPQVLARFAFELTQLATATAKQVRAAAEPVVIKCGASAVPELRKLASKGKPEQRLQALRILHALAKHANDAALAVETRELASQDAAPSIRALLSEWDAVAGSTTPGDAPSVQAMAAVELPKIDWGAPLSASCWAAIDTLWREIDEAVVRHNEQLRKRHEAAVASGNSYQLYLIDRPTDVLRQELRAYLESSAPTRKSKHSENYYVWRQQSAAFARFAAAEGVTPVVLARVLMFFDCLGRYEGYLDREAVATFNAMYAARKRPTLLELAEILKGLKRDGGALIHNICTSGRWSMPLATEWDDADVWPFLAHYLPKVIELVTTASAGGWDFDRSALFRSIGRFPTPPPQLVNALFDVALGTSKKDRVAAQDALASMPGKEARIVNALADGKSETRTVAAEWLGRLRYQDAIPALEKALAKEKHDLPKSAILSALQLLGQPIEKYLDRAALTAEAAKSLAKGVPKDLEWFPWSAIPEVRWAKDGAAVPSDVLRWLLVQAVKQKSPEPSVLLQTYAAMFEPRDRERFGQFVLDTWLREDARPIASEDAMQRAKAQATSMHGYMQRSPQYFQNDPNFGRSIEELTAIYFKSYAKLPIGSAVNSKGLLAVAAACAGERAAAPTGRFLKDWYGTRAAQGKALIAMLAWIEHPSATQLMLSIGSRFRTKSFQEEATKQAEALADRKGWTLAELADRTIPSAGFDETGTLELNYGMRVFEAKLLPDFKVELYNPEGKKIASLPEPRQDDDAELAKEAKKAFSAAKKEIKSVVDLQTDRLYEALCTERDWPADDWVRYLNQHPIMRKLVQRLVWMETRDGQTLNVFRPLDDGSLSDCDDNAITLNADTRIRLAHDSLLEPDQVARWQQHLVDYEVVPLFQQLGKGLYDLPADKRNADAVTDFEGHMIEAFALRGRALKLGYTRGAPQDGGWFFSYDKRFPTLGLIASIEFTGNGLPEENRNVALQNLTFSAMSEGAYSDTRLPLGKVPRILLSECFNDMRLIAAEGTGYDADWQKKSGY